MLLLYTFSTYINIMNLFYKLNFNIIYSKRTHFIAITIHIMILLREINPFSANLKIEKFATMVKSVDTH